MFDTIFGTSSRTATPNTGLSVPPNTFAHELLDGLEARGFDELAVDLPVRVHADTNLGGDPFAAAQLARTSQATWVEDEADRYVDLASVVHTATLGGTGYLAHRFAGVPHETDSSMEVLEVLVGSDETAVERKAQTTIAQVFAYPFLERGAVLLSNRVRESSERRVATDVGRLIATVARHDLADLKHYCYTAHYERIEVAGNRRTKADFARILGDVVRDEAWFDPSDWLWWEPARDPGPALGEETEAIAVVPEGYEDVNLNGRGTVHAMPADVEDIHVVVLRTLRREWVRELRVGGLRWLRESIVEGRDKFADLWSSYVRDQGRRDPREAFDEFLRDNYTSRTAEEAVEAVLEGHRTAPETPVAPHPSEGGKASHVGGFGAEYTDGGVDARPVRRRSTETDANLAAAEDSAVGRGDPDGRDPDRDTGGRDDPDGDADDREA